MFDIVHGWEKYRRFKAELDALKVQVYEHEQGIRSLEFPDELPKMQRDIKKLTEHIDNLVQQMQEAADDASR